MTNTTEKYYFYYFPNETLAYSIPFPSAVGRDFFHEQSTFEMFKSRDMRCGMERMDNQSL
jgi:hypothetical protein